MFKKIVIKAAFILTLLTLVLVNNKIYAETNDDLIYHTIYDETFERATGSIFDTTFLWAEQPESLITSNNPITGNKSLLYSFHNKNGDFVLLGGTNQQLLLQNNTYKISFDFKTSDVDFFNISVEEVNTWLKYYEYVYNPVIKARVDGNNNPKDLLEGETLTINETTGVVSVSFVLEAKKDTPSSIVFIARANGNNSEVLIDNFLVEVLAPNITFKEHTITNFDQISGKLHENSSYWVSDDRGTSIVYLENTPNAIEKRSVGFVISKTDFEILGGSQGDKLKLVGGHKFKITMDLRLIDVSHFALKVKEVDSDTTIREIYFDEYGQRLPGSYPITDKEAISINDGVIHLEFYFDSKLGQNSYLYFEAKSKVIGSMVVMDNINVYEEAYETTYQTYMMANEFTFDDGLLPDDLNANSNYTFEPYIRGDNSLKFIELDRFKWNSLLTVNSNVMTDKVGKIHLKGHFKDITNVTISLYEEDSIIHEMYFNANTLVRSQTYGKAYLDQGILKFYDDKVYIDYVLPELNQNNNYHLEIKVYATTNNAYVYLDDLTLLTLNDHNEIDETLPENPSKNQGGRVTLSSGSDKDYIISLDRGSSVITWILVIGSSLLVIGVSVFAVIFVVKKKKVIVIKVLTILLAGLLSIFTPLALFNNFIEFNDSLSDKLKPLQTELSDFNYYYPEKLGGNLDNPGMGWVTLEEPTYGGVPDMGTSGELPEVKNVSLSTSWALIEKEEGLYDWTLLDQIIDYYTDLGKRINFRIVTDSLMLPNTYNGVPTWLFNKYNVPYEMLNYTDPGPVSVFKVVDTRNVDYQRHLSLFLEALATKYKDNPLIDVVEIRGWGNWGEWHSGYSYPTMENRMNSLQDIINKYVDAFSETNKLLVLSAAWDPYYIPYNSYEDYIEFSAFDYAMRLDNVTFRRDSGANLLNYNTDERLLSDFFRSGKRLPLLGEFSSGIEQSYTEQFGFDLMGGIDDILFKMRPNYSTVLGWVNSNVAQVVDDGNSAFWERGVEKLGYRIELDYARFPKVVSPEVENEYLFAFSNSAVGRFWYKYPLKVYFYNDNDELVHSELVNNFDARTYVLGEINYVYANLTLPESVREGNYKIRIAIVDELGNPAIRMGFAGEIDDTLIYEVGSVTVKHNNTKKTSYAKELTYLEALDYNFDSNQTYAITVKYLPKFNVSDYYFGDDRGYVFALTSEKGGNGATVGYNKWQDVSGEVSHKTFLVTTQNYNDYQLNLLSDGFGDLEILKVYIEKSSGYYEHFENYDFTNLNSWFLPTSRSSATITKYDNIAGKESILIHSDNIGDFYALKLDTNVAKLKANTTYTVFFKFESTALVGKGGYMFLELIDEADNTSKRIGEWYERMDRGITTQTFTFSTDNTNTQTVAWGIRHTGEYVIDDVIIIEQPNGVIINGDDYAHPKNVRPKINYTTFGEVEDFEKLSVAQTAFERGQFGWGYLTYNPKYVISGNASLMGQVEDEALVNEWFEFARSNRLAYPFLANKTYNVKFKYRILKNPPGGIFYVLFRDSIARLESDVGYMVIPNATTANLNTVLEIDMTVTLGNYDNYQFIFGMRFLGEIVIDHVIITAID